MSDESQRKDDVFGARLGRVLRTSERFSDDFEKELVVAIGADRPIERDPVRDARPLEPAWWRAPITVRVSPLVALAIAASLVAIIGLGAAELRASPAPAPVAIAAGVVHDTVNVVRFVFVGEAKTVSLVGDFNAWGARPVPLTTTGANGAWTVSLPLVNGRHEYAFIVDGKRWVADPFAPASSDEFNTNSSIITVGT